MSDRLFIVACVGLGALTVVLMVLAVALK